ncbi:hypothetical protein [Streptomyces sp. NPDC095817]|uniref:hypothetical protein n=1 Tax=Streptomyces sp. NPDC095817 TaxID=3155082 RepID=UPI0033302EC2
MGTLVYDGPYERAGALLHCLVQVATLESGNELVASQLPTSTPAAPRGAVSGPEVIRLIDDILHGRCDVRQAAELLKT